MNGKKIVIITECNPLVVTLIIADLSKIAIQLIRNACTYIIIVYIVHEETNGVVLNLKHSASHHHENCSQYL